MKYSEEQIESILDKVNELLDSYSKADFEFQTNQRRKDWKDKYGEKFKPYEDKMKVLNGDDFDLMESSRNEYESEYSDLSSDDYCNALEANIKKTLERIWPEASNEEIEQATEEIVETAEEDSEASEASEASETSEPSEASETSEDEVVEDTEDPNDSFRKELEIEMLKIPKRNKEEE